MGNAAASTDGDGAGPVAGKGLLISSKMEPKAGRTLPTLHTYVNFPHACINVLSCSICAICNIMTETANDPCHLVKQLGLTGMFGPCRLISCKHLSKQCRLSTVDYSHIAKLSTFLSSCSDWLQTRPVHKQSAKKSIHGLHYSIISNVPAALASPVMMFFICFDPLQLLQGDASMACDCLQTRLLTTAASGHQDLIPIHATHITQVITSKLCVMLWTEPCSVVWVNLFTWLGAVSSQSLLVCLPGHLEGAGFKAVATCKHHLQPSKY